MMAGCNCGSRLGGSTKYNLVDASTGKVLKTYSSESDARLASSRQPGTRVRPA